MALVRLLRRPSRRLILLVTVFAAVLVSVRLILFVSRCTPIVDRMIAMPDGRAIPLYNPNIQSRLLSQVIDDCDYNASQKLICPNVKHLGETVTRQLQLSIGRMLRIVELMASKHKFQYWLWAGTLIGAHRDQRFLAWDQDADIHMMRSDFETFKKHAAEDLPADLFLQTIESDADYAKATLYNEAKIRDSSTCYGYCPRAGCTFHDGLQVDIVVFEITSTGIIEDTYRTYKFYYDDIFPLQRVKYEGFSFFAPLETAKLLPMHYGDISKAPRPEEQCKKFMGIPWSSCEGIMKMNSSYREHLLFGTIMSRYPKLLNIFT